MFSDFTNTSKQRNNNTIPLEMYISYSHNPLGESRQIASVGKSKLNKYQNRSEMWLSKSWNLMPGLHSRRDSTRQDENESVKGTFVSSSHLPHSWPVFISSQIVMGSIEENWYRYNIDTFAKVLIVSILRYPSENPHHKLHIRKFVTYFDVFQLSDFEFFLKFLGFFDICPVSAPFWVISLNFFLAFLVTISVTIPSIDT